MHRVTVYRTLEMLKSYGLLDELDLLHIHGHRHYYESHGPRDHIHVACLRCGKVREVESDLFEQLKRQVERDTGISITVARVEIGGYCESCRRQGSAAWFFLATSELDTEPGASGGLRGLRRVAGKIRGSRAGRRQSACAVRRVR